MVAICPVEEPHSAGKRGCNQHVVWTCEDDLVEAATGIYQGSLARSNVSREVGQGQELDGYVLKQVRNLGVLGNKAKASVGVTQAQVLGKTWQKLKHALSCLSVF